MRAVSGKVNGLQESHSQTWASSESKKPPLMLHVTVKLSSLFSSSLISSRKGDTALLPFSRIPTQNRSFRVRERRVLRGFLPPLSCPRFTGAVPAGSEDGGGGGCGRGVR